MKLEDNKQIPENTRWFIIMNYALIWGLCKLQGEIPNAARNAATDILAQLWSVYQFYKIPEHISHQSIKHIVTSTINVWLKLRLGYNRSSSRYNLTGLFEGKHKTDISGVGLGARVRKNGGTHSAETIPSRAFRGNRRKFRNKLMIKDRSCKFKIIIWNGAVSIQDEYSIIRVMLCWANNTAQIQYWANRSNDNWLIFHSQLRTRSLASLT